MICHDQQFNIVSHDNDDMCSTRHSQNMDWTGLDGWTGLDWTAGLDWTGQLYWTDFNIHL